MAKDEFLMKRLKRLANDIDRKARQAGEGTGLYHALRVTAEEIRQAIREDGRASDGGGQVQFLGEFLKR